MTFKLVSLVGVNEKDQSMVSNARLELEWEDYLLSWNASAYGDIDSILVKQKNIWLPDIIIGNSVSTHTKMGYDDLPVRVNFNGFIVWSPSVLVTTACDIKVTYYPFDAQICNIEYETTVSLSTEVDINIDQQNPVLTNDFSKDGQWILEDYHAINLSNEDSKTKIRFQLLLRRRTTFYIVNIILPVLFLSLTASLVFAIPADAGEKMGTGITVLLAYAVYLTIVTDYLPSTSLQTSILSLYLTILLGYTACAVVLSVLVLRVYHKPDSDLVGSKVATLTWVLQKITFYSTSQSYKIHRNAVSPTGDKKDEADGDDRYTTMNTPPLYHEHLTWQIVSKTLDWFFFLLFTSMVLLTTLICMLTLVMGGNYDSTSFSRQEN